MGSPNCGKLTATWTFRNPREISPFRPEDQKTRLQRAREWEGNPGRERLREDDSPKSVINQHNASRHHWIAHEWVRYFTHNTSDTKCVGFFSLQWTNFLTLWTSTECRTIQFNSDTNYQKLASDATVLRARSRKIELHNGSAVKKLPAM